MPYNSFVQVPVTFPPKPGIKVTLRNDLHGAMVKRPPRRQVRWRWPCPRRYFHCGVRSHNRTWWRQRVRSRNVKPWVKVTWMMVKYQIDQRLSRSFKRPPWGKGERGIGERRKPGSSDRRWKPHNCEGSDRDNGMSCVTVWHEPCWSLTKLMRLMFESVSPKGSSSLQNPTNIITDLWTIFCWYL